MHDLFSCFLKSLFTHVCCLCKKVRAIMHTVGLQGRYVEVICPTVKYHRGACKCLCGLPLGMLSICLVCLLWLVKCLHCVCVHMHIFGSFVQFRGSTIVSYVQLLAGRQHNGGKCCWFFFLVRWIFCPSVVNLFHNHGFLWGEEKRKILKN